MNAARRCSSVAPTSAAASRATHAIRLSESRGPSSCTRQVRGDPRQVVRSRGEGDAGEDAPHDAESLDCCRNVSGNG
jgi:hypothetical protein